MALVDGWIAAQLDPHLGRGALLVLASSRPLAMRIRRHLAEAGGRFDVEVTTPRALVHQLASRALSPPPVPPSRTLVERYDDRPGLAALARSHLEAASAARIAGADLSALPAAWQDAATAGTGTPFEQGLTRLFAAPRAGAGLHLLGGVSFQRVVAIGFVAPGPPWVERLLDHLRVKRLPSPLFREPIQWEPATDPSAEARAAVSRLSSGSADDTLILVQDRATALRVRDALVRNGLPCAWTDAGSLGAHPLAAAARQAARWLVSGSDPLLRAGEIEHWIGRAGVGRALGESGEAACALAGGAPWFSRRSLVEALESARLLEAPLSRWITRLRALPPARDDESQGLVPTAIRLAYALERLQDPGGEQPGTIGAVRRLLLDLGVRFFDDPVARTLLGAMRELADVPADAVAMEDLLSRPLDARELRPGAEILTYDEYDGRPSRRLILLDLHDKGIGRRPLPDPLLDEAGLRAIGGRSVATALHERLDQLRRACAQTEAVFAVVPARDAAGRPVIPPPGLRLAAVARPPDPLPLPERTRWDILARREGAMPESDDAPDLASHLARQATLEWIRGGCSGTPPALAPWCGDAGEAGHLSLAAPWSVSQLFRPLAHCPWQAFASVILRSKARDTVSEELDPSEVGTAVHLALERAGPRLRWRPSEDDTPAARAEAVALLVEETERAFAEQRDALGGLSPARSTAVDGGGARWAGHWPTWAISRIRERFGSPSLIADTSLLSQPSWSAAIARFDELLPAEIAASREKRAQAVKRFARIKAGGDVPDRDSALGTHTEHELPEAALAALRTLWVDPALERLAHAWRELEERSAVLLEPITAVATEVRLEGIEVALGPVRARVNGQIDRVDRVGRWLRIVDYKTGAMPNPRTLLESLSSGVEPQLLVYALALRAASWPTDHALADAEVAAVGWDYLRDALEHDKRDAKRMVQTDRLVVGSDLLDHAAETLGARVAAAAAGRWPLTPDARTCPMLASWGHDHCAYAGACRLRGLPA